MPSIDPRERRRREDAFNYARASIGLEGFKISEALEQHARRFINGEIDMAEFLKGTSDDAAQESNPQEKPNPDLSDRNESNLDP